MDKSTPAYLAGYYDLYKNKDKSNPFVVGSSEHVEYNLGYDEGFIEKLKQLIRRAEHYREGIVFHRNNGSLMSLELVHTFELELQRLEAEIAKLNS